MFPSWARGVIIRGAVLASASLGLVIGVCLVKGSLGQGAQTPTPAKQPTPIARIDQLHLREPRADDGGENPNQLKPPRQEVAQPKQIPGKPISLNAAITLVENAGKGEVVKGEKAGEGPSAQFNLEVISPKGERLRLVVSATGKVIVETPEAPRKKGKGKQG